MPSYRFNFVGSDVETAVDAELPDDDSAERQGLETMAQLDWDRAIGNPTDLAIEILDAGGRFIAMVIPRASPTNATKGRHSARVAAIGRAIT